MKSHKISRKRRAVSPVIATVILVAITITVAVAVSYWMSGIAGQYTKFEKIEIQSGYSEKIDNGLSPASYGWQITLEMKNTGSATSTLLRVFVNDIAIPVDNYGESAITYAGGQIFTSVVYAGTTIESGGTTTVYIWIDDGWGAPVTSGTTLNVKVHSAAGMDYIKLVSLV